MLPTRSQSTQSYSQRLAAARAATIEVKALLSSLIIQEVRSDHRAGTYVKAHSDELIRAKPKLEAAGYHVLIFKTGHLLGCSKS